MAVNKIRDKDSFMNYVLRKLGAPVIRSTSTKHKLKTRLMMLYRSFGSTIATVAKMHSSFTR